MKDNLKAFPSKELDWQETSIQERDVYNSQNEGMDLRDYFAAKIIQGIIPLELGQSSAINMAEFSYELADAMMEARKK